MEVWPTNLATCRAPWLPNPTLLPRHVDTSCCQCGKTILISDVGQAFFLIFMRVCLFIKWQQKNEQVLFSPENATGFVFDIAPCWISEPYRRTNAKNLSIASPEHCGGVGGSTVPLPSNSFQVCLFSPSRHLPQSFSHLTHKVPSTHLLNVWAIELGLRVSQFLTTPYFLRVLTMNKLVSKIIAHPVPNVRSIPLCSSWKLPTWASSFSIVLFEL